MDVAAVVLANLCVSHIMSSQNDEAEDLMRRCVYHVELCCLWIDPNHYRIEREEERVIVAEPLKQCLHLCIVNLGAA